MPFRIHRAAEGRELVTGDTADLPAQLQAVTGQRIAVLEGIGELKRDDSGRAREVLRTEGGTIAVEHGLSAKGSRTAAYRTKEEK